MTARQAAQASPGPTAGQLVKALTSPAIVASALPANFARLGEDCRALEKAGADRIQWDLMDGRFVPNLTFGPDTVAAARAETGLPFEAHLMTLEPEVYTARLADAGVELMIVHAEACPHLHRVLASIRDAGLRTGVALNPATPLDAVAHVLDLTDLILVMTVNPGFGGQRYLASMEPKITAARRLIGTAPHPVELEVDGGIGLQTAGPAAAAGADVLVAGSALFNHPGGQAAAVTALRAAAEKGRP